MTSSTTPKVVLAGLPNAGKSTLFNRLVGSSLALVSEEEGTTRDYLGAFVTHQGVAFELIDAAGWDDQAFGVGGAAQQQRADQVRRAALMVWCTPCDLTERQQERDDAALRESNPGSTPLLRVRTKCDAASKTLSEEGQTPDRRCCDGHRHAEADDVVAEEVQVSARTGIGIEELRRRIVERLTCPASRSSEWLGMTAARCQSSLEQAASALNRAENAARLSSCGDELLAVDLREALDHLGQIVGAVYTDDLLDRIFSKFCIGK
jgi:tRNA modification GTPase